MLSGDAVAFHGSCGKRCNGDGNNDDGRKTTMVHYDVSVLSKNLFMGICFIHCFLLIVIVGLVSVIFSRNPSLSLILSQGYILIPGTSGDSSGGCKVWVNGECVEVMNYEFKNSHNNNNINNNNLETIKGKMEMAESKAMGLFSCMNAPVVCLVMQVISTVFYLALAPVRDQDLSWAMRRFSFITFVFFAILILLMQTTWLIPSNNILWLEVLLLACMFTLGSKHKYLKWWEWGGEGFSDIPHVLSAAFTVPSLGVIALVVAGEDNTEGLIIVYFGLVGSILFKLLEIVSFCDYYNCSHYDDDDENNKKKKNMGQQLVEDSNNESKNKKNINYNVYQYNISEPIFVARLNMWLCLIPFIALASLRFEAISNLPSELTPTHWGFAALVYALIWFLCSALYFTVSSYNAKIDVYCVAIHQFLHVGLVLQVLCGFITSTS